MYLGLLIPACILCGVVTIVSFFLYIRCRMKPRSEEEDAGLRDARLERQEQRYQQTHFISLVLFVLLGVLILIELSHRYNPPRIDY